MIKIFYCLLIFQSLCCFSFEDEFSDICSKDVELSDCLDYERRGLDYYICRWWHYFPSLRDLDLLTEKNSIHIFSQPYCDAWLTSKPSNLKPDIEGNYCKDDDAPLDPKILQKSDPERAFLCAKRLQAENFLKAKSLFLLSQHKKVFSEHALEIFARVKEYFETNKATIEKEYSDLFVLDFPFPRKMSSNSWRKYFW